MCLVRFYDDCLLLMVIEFVVFVVEFNYFSDFIDDGFINFFDVYLFEVCDGFLKLIMV